MTCCEYCDGLGKKRESGVFFLFWDDCEYCDGTGGEDNEEQDEGSSQQINEGQ